MHKEQKNGGHFQSKGAHDFYFNKKMVLVQAHMAVYSG